MLWIPSSRTVTCAKPQCHTLGLIYEPPSILERIDLAVLFPKNLPLEVELGSGDGSFLVEYAINHPERNFIGVERLFGRLRKMARKGQRAGLSNLRGIRIESEQRLANNPPSIYFRDPDGILPEPAMYDVWPWKG